MKHPVIHIQKVFAGNNSGCKVTLEFPPITWVECENPLWQFFDTSFEAKEITPLTYHTMTIDSVKVFISDMEMYIASDDYSIYRRIEEEVVRLDLPMEVQGRVLEYLGHACKNAQFHSGTPGTPATSADKNELSREAMELPGARTLIERLPCLCPMGLSLLDCIIHLNDKHKWTRERIADWLDRVADAGLVDIDFPTPDSVDFDRDAVNGLKEKL